MVENHESGDTVNIYGWIEPLNPTVNVLRAFSIASCWDLARLLRFSWTGRRLTQGALANRQRLSTSSSFP